MPSTGNLVTYFLRDSEVAKFRLQRFARHTRRVVREMEKEHGLSLVLSHGYGRLMALHAAFPNSPYETLLPEFRWFPAAEELRSTAYEKLLPPLVAHIREAVRAWRDADYAGASGTSIGLLNWWFKSNHLIEQADGSQSVFRYYFAQREAVETIIWLYDVRGTRDKFDLLRFDASGAVSANMFDEAWCLSGRMLSPVSRL